VALKTVQAAVILSMTYSVHGLDKIGSFFLEHAVATANRLQLFNAPKENRDTHSQVARAITAWGLYSYQS